MGPLTSWSTKPLRTTGLFKLIILILRKRNLHSSLKLPLPISFSVWWSFVWADWWCSNRLSSWPVNSQCVHVPPREQLTRNGMVPSLYKRYYDDTLARMPSTINAADFLTTLNGLHPSLKFTMELPADNMIPFIGIEIIKNGTVLETCVYREPTNTDLLLHFHSHEVKPSYKVTNPVYWRPCYIVPMPCHLWRKPSMRNVLSYALSSPDFIIQLASQILPLICLFRILQLSQKRKPMKETWSE